LIKKKCHQGHKIVNTLCIYFKFGQNMTTTVWAIHTNLEVHFIADVYTLVTIVTQLLGHWSTYHKFTYMCSWIQQMYNFYKVTNNVFSRWIDCLIILKCLLSGYRCEFTPSQSNYYHSQCTFGTVSSNSVRHGRNHGWTHFIWSLLLTCLPEQGRPEPNFLSTIF
jgi:hypothetical protein